MFTIDEHNKQPLPYEPPYAYFENFENRVKARLEAKPVFWSPKMSWAWSLAVLVLVAVVVYQFSGSTTNTKSLSAVESAHLVDYLIENGDYQTMTLALELELAELPQASWLADNQLEKELEGENLEFLMTEL